MFSLGKSLVIESISETRKLVIKCLAGGVSFTRKPGKQIVVPDAERGVHADRIAALELLFQKGRSRLFKLGLCPAVGVQGIVERFKTTSRPVVESILFKVEENRAKRTGDVQQNR